MNDFWNNAASGKNLYLQPTEKTGNLTQSAGRYRLESWIEPFAYHEALKSKRVLEIGEGLGDDHHSFAAVRADLLWN